MSTHTSLAAGFHQLESSGLPFTFKLHVVVLNRCQKKGCVENILNMWVKKAHSCWKKIRNAAKEAEASRDAQTAV